MDKRLEILCNLYDRSDENVNTNALLKVCFLKNLGEVLRLLSEIQCVKFAYLCAKSVFHLKNKKTKEKAEKCLELVEKWLENSDSISCEELRKAAYVANDIANYASAYAVAHAAAAITHVVGAAAYAAYAVYCGDRYTIVDDVVSVATHATHAAKNKQEQEYKALGFLVKVIRDEP